MLRVVGESGDPATRIENRLGEPAANPYLYMASQILAGLDGMTCGLVPPPATHDPYGAGDGIEMIPTALAPALHALRSDAVLTAGLGETFVNYYSRIKRSEADRFDAAEDKDDFNRREYFSRY
jgi:glutamine synthetase